MDRFFYDLFELVLLILAVTFAFSLFSAIFGGS